MRIAGLTVLQTLDFSEPYRRARPHKHWSKLMSGAVPPWLPRYGTKVHQTPANIDPVRRYGQIHPLPGGKSSQPTVDPAPGTAARFGTAGAVPLALTPNRPFLRGNPRSSEANRGNLK